jgi:DNA-binding transcriptional LysR family regulator
VAALERELGVRLLHRTTRALQPTEAGRLYHARMRALLNEWDLLDAETRDASGALRGPIRLTVPQSYGACRVAPLLCRFAAEHPAVSLDVRFTDRAERLVEEGLDLAVRVGRPTDSSLVGRKVGEMRLLLVAAPAYLARRGEPSSAEDLAAHDCVLDTNLRDPGRWPVAGRRVAVAGRLALSDPRACLLAAEAGLGLALTLDFLAGAALAAGRVRHVLPDLVNEALPVHALTPSGRQPPARVRTLVEALARDLDPSVPPGQG